jgi:hypothetical protein
MFNRNYSIDMLLRASFLLEWSNLNTLPIDQVDKKVIIIKEYFETRIKSIDKIYM